MPWSSHNYKYCRYSYFTGNICNRCIDSLKILFEEMTEARSAIVTTIWRPGFMQQNLFHNEWRLQYSYAHAELADVLEAGMLKIDFS